MTSSVKELRERGWENNGSFGVTTHLLNVRIYQSYSVLHECPLRRVKTFEKLFGNSFGAFDMMEEIRDVLNESN